MKTKSERTKGIFWSRLFNAWPVILIVAIFGGMMVLRSNAATAPTNLVLTGLDSTIRANWTASTDPTTTHHVVSVWTGDGNTSNGSKLISSKVLGPTANAADLNGLKTGDTFTVKVQARDSSGALSSPVTASTKTDPQYPMANAAYYDNFDEVMHGTPLNPDYYDVRTWSGYGDTFDVNDDVITAFNGERHFHGQVIESQGQGGVLIRTRVPGSLVNADGSNRTLTFQTEVDIPPLQSIHGKWFEIHFTQNPVGTHAVFGSGAAHFPNDVSFQLVANSCTGEQRNTASIVVNTSGNERVFCTEPLQQISPLNVRVPIVLKVSKTLAQMYVNGKLVGQASGFTLPYDTGYWSIMDENYRSGYDATEEGTSPTITNSLTHWDMIQFDGPEGSYNPVVKTYIQKGCPGLVITDYHSIRNCPAIVPQGGNKGTTTVEIPATDDLSKIRSAKLQFSGPHQNPVVITLNGQNLVTLPARVDEIDTQQQLNYYDLTPQQIAMLKNGTNTFTLSSSLAGSNNWNVLSQLELEVIYNQQRTIANPDQQFMPMFLFTNYDTRIDHIAGQPNVVTGTTYLYASGADAASTYSLSQINPDANPWFTITSATTGTIKPLPAGGALIPINYSIDFSKYVQPSARGLADSADGMGTAAIIKASGAMAPVYATVVAVKDQRTSPITPKTYTYNEAVYNKAALPVGLQTTTPPITAYNSDLNDDGEVNIFDLSILLGKWGSASGGNADIDSNGTVNVLDLSYLLSRWGS